MRNLGLLYYSGRKGAEPDYPKAREWYGAAPANDYAGAMGKLGVLIAGGHGVLPDYAKAREWFERAAARDDGVSMGYLAQLHRNGQGVEQDYAKAREWYEKAAAKGEVVAMFDLALLNSTGQGGAQDYAKAREWYEKAAAKGNREAKMALERLPAQEAETAGRYDEALRLEEAFAAKFEAEETKRDGKSGKRVVTELNAVVWYALFAKQFTKALTVADRAHTLFPNNLGIETNRAHALMFTGGDEEAKALYVAHKGEPVSEVGNKLWEQAIAEDFAQFRKAGLTHPMMADIEKELGISR
jgi:TPR repeat protein